MKKTTRIFTLTCSIMFVFGFSLFLAPMIFAGSGAPGIGSITTPPGFHTAGWGDSVELVNAVLSFLTGVAAVWLMITIVLSGMKIIQSAKSPEDFNTHMKKIMWSAVGMVVVALSYIVVTWILTRFFGDSGALDNPVEKLQP